MNINQTNSRNFRAQFVETTISKKLFDIYKPNMNTSKLINELKKLHPETKLDIVEFEQFNLEQTEHLNVIIKNLNNNIKNKIFVVKHISKDNNLINLFIENVIDKAKKNTRFWKKNLQ